MGDFDPTDSGSGNHGVLGRQDVEFNPTDSGSGNHGVLGRQDVEEVLVVGHTLGDIDQLFGVIVALILQLGAFMRYLAEKLRAKFSAMQEVVTQWWKMRTPWTTSSDA